MSADPRDEPAEPAPLDRAALLAAAGIVPRPTARRMRIRLRATPPLDEEMADTRRAELRAAIEDARDGDPIGVSALVDALGVGLATPVYTRGRETRGGTNEVRPLVYRAGSAALLRAIVSPWGEDARPLVKRMLRAAKAEANCG